VYGNPEADNQGKFQYGLKNYAKNGEGRSIRRGRDNQCRREAGIVRKLVKNLKKL